MSSQPSLLNSMGAKAATQGGNIAIQGSQSSSPDLNHELGHAAENLASRGSITAAPAPMPGSNVCAPGSADEKAADARADDAAKKG